MPLRQADPICTGLRSAEFALSKFCFAFLFFCAAAFLKPEVASAQAAQPLGPARQVVSDNSDVLQATLDVVYYCKLVADESFIRRRAAHKLRSAAEQEGCQSAVNEILGSEDGDLSCDNLASRLQFKAGARDAAKAFERRCFGVKRSITSKPLEEGYRRPVFEIYLISYGILHSDWMIENVRSSEARDRFDLLAKDLEFRSEILSIGEDFWGGTFTAVPSIPPLHLASFTGLLEQLELLAKEVRELQWRVDDKSLKTLEFTAQATVAEGEIRASLPSADKLNVMRKEAEQRIASASEQLRLLSDRQQAIAAEQTQIKAQIQSLTASLNNMVAGAIASYLGVPPELQQVAQGGSVEDAFKSYVGSQAGQILADEKIMSSFGEIGKTMTVYTQRVQEIKKEVEGYVKDAERVRDVVVNGRQYVDEFKAVLRQPTLDNLEKIGSRVLANLPPEQFRSLRNGFCQIVDKQKPLQALLEQAREPGELSNRIKTAIRGSLDQIPNPPNMTDYLRSVLNEVSPARRVSWFADLVERGAEISLPSDAADALKTKLVRIIAELWPRSLITMVPSSHRARLMEVVRQRLGIGSEDELIDKIEAVASPRLFVRNGVVAITVGQEAFPLGQFDDVRKLVRQVRSFEADINSLQSRMEKGLRELVSTDALRDTIAREILEQVPFAELERRVDGLRNNVEQKAKIFSSAVSKLGERTGLDCTNGGAVERLVNSQVGARMAKELAEAQAAAAEFEKAPSQAPLPGGAPPSPPKGLSPEFQMASAALNTAFPGAGAALSFAASAFMNMQETAHLANKINELTAESNRLLQIEVQLQATLETTRIALQINKLDGEVSDIKRQQALKQYDALTRANQKSGEQTLRGLGMIQRRQPLIFYIAERLRQEYDLLDRSIALWGPAGGTVRDAIATLIKEDPQNIRLALDSDIHLFQWLDRSEERVRTDIDRILAHWRQIFRIVTDVCDRVGCHPGKSRLGHVQQTPMVDVCDLMQLADCRRLRAWINADPSVERRGQDVFSTLLTFPTSGDIVPTHLLNVRVIDVRLGAYTKPPELQRLRINSAQLLHPGVSFIRHTGGYAREAHAPSETASFDWPSFYDLEAVSTRWNAGARPSRRFFEGYGLLTTWRLVITRTPTINQIYSDAPSESRKKLKDSSGIFVRFAYSYHLPPITSDVEPPFVAPNEAVGEQLVRPMIKLAGKGTAQARTIEFPESILKLIGDSSDYAAAQHAWLNPDASPKVDAKLSCDAVQPDARRASFATQICLGSVDPSQRDRTIRAQTKSLVGSCLNERALVSFQTESLRDREVNHLLATRYAKVFSAAYPLVEANMAGRSHAVHLCGSDYKSTFELCKAIREGVFAKCLN